MKSLKAAAVVAGSLVVAGAAAPAFAQDTADLAPGGLNGLVGKFSEPLQLKSMHVQGDALDTEKEGTPLNGFKDLTTELNSKKGLLGGLPLTGSAS